jgi:hypothetical protein
MMAVEIKGRFWKQMLPIDLNQADAHAVVPSSLVWVSTGQSWAVRCTQRTDDAVILRTGRRSHVPRLNLRLVEAAAS